MTIFLNPKHTQSHPRLPTQCPANPSVILPRPLRPSPECRLSVDPTFRHNPTQPTITTSTSPFTTTLHHRLPFDPILQHNPLPLPPNTTTITHNRERDRPLTVLRRPPSTNTHRPASPSLALESPSCRDSSAPPDPEPASATDPFPVPRRGQIRLASASSTTPWRAPPGTTPALAPRRA